MKVILVDTLKERGMSQYALTAHTGIAVSTISKLCNNKTSRIDFENLDKICTVLNCDVDDILVSDKHPDVIDNLFSFKLSF